MKMFKNILENNPYPCFSFKDSGEIIYNNPAADSFLQDWNKGKKTLLVKNLKILLYQNNLNLQNIEILANGNYYRFEVTRLSDHEYSFFGSNVTFQKNTADTLFNLIDHIEEGLFLIDIDNEGQFVEVNNTAATSLGYTREEMLSLKLKDIIIEFPLKDQKEWNEYVDSVKKQAGKQTKNFEFKRKDGTTFPVETITSIKSVMEKDYQVTLARDITERLKEEKAKEELKVHMFASAKLSHLGEMSTSIAHEINNPLTIIHAKTLNLKKRLLADKFEKDKSLKDLAVVDKTIKKITKVIGSLRNISQSQDEHSYCNEIVEDIFRDVLTLFIERVKQMDVDLQITGEDQIIGLEAYCNRSQIAQVFVSLLNNSFEAIAKLPEKWVKIDISYTNGDVIMAFTDSGTSIAPDTVEHMFEPFFSTKVLGKGAGLGLSISKSILHKHSGELTYDKTGKNTRFKVTLPAQKAGVNFWQN